MTALREILASFGITVDTKTLENADKKIDGFMGTLRKAGEVFAGVFAVKEVGEFFKAQVEGAAHLEDTAEKLGLTTDEIQRFQYAMKGAGIEADSAAHSLGFLSKNIGEALTGTKESAEVFSQLKIHLKDSAGQTRNVGDVLFDVSDAFKGMHSQAERASYSMKLFGREGQQMLPILSQGSDAVEDLYSQADDLGIVMGGDFYRNAKAAREEMEHFEMVVGAMKATVTQAALPGITAMFLWLQKVATPVLNMVKHTNALQHALEFLTALGVLKLLTKLGELYKLLGGFKNLGIVAALVALYVAFDDVKTLLEGGDSLLGRWLTKMYGLEGKEKFVQRIKDAWEDLKKTLSSAGAIFYKFLSDAGFDGLDAALTAFGAAAVVGAGYLAALTATAVVAAAPWIALGAAILVTVAALDKAVEAYKLAASIKAFENTPLGQRVDKEGYDAVNKDLDTQADAARDERIAKRGTSQSRDTFRQPATFDRLDMDHPAVSSVRQPAAFARDTAPKVASKNAPPVAGAQVSVSPTVHVTVQGGKNPKADGQVTGDAVVTEIQNAKYDTLTNIGRP